VHRGVRAGIPVPDFGPVRSRAPSSRFNPGGERIFGKCVRRVRPGRKKVEQSSKDIQMYRANSIACLRICDKALLLQHREAMHNFPRQVFWFVRRSNELYARRQIAVV
jgi:hypothetical protein